VSDDAIAQANETLRAKGYSERQLQVHATPLEGRALLKGDRILSPFSDDADLVLRVVRDLVPDASELRGQLRPADLRAQLG
jgi:hypothetical protein